MPDNDAHEAYDEAQLSFCKAQPKEKPLKAPKVYGPELTLWFASPVY